MDGTELIKNYYRFEQEVDESVKAYRCGDVSAVTAIEQVFNKLLAVRQQREEFMDKRGK